MNPKFKECVEKNKIVTFPAGKRLVNKELISARKDLEDAKFGLAYGKYKWPTIQGYYAMYHAARALLFSKQYREKSHYCLYVAMIMRENADYRSEFSKKRATEVIEKAEYFLGRATEILK